MITKDRGLVGSIMREVPARYRACAKNGMTLRHWSDGVLGKTEILNAQVRPATSIVGKSRGIIK